MTLLCAPVKKWIKTDKVDLLEIDKIVYDLEGNRRYEDLVSYHNYEETPDLSVVLHQMKQAHPNARLYKIATMANSTLDSLRMMEFQKPGVLGLCMGPLGSITRICAPIFGVPIMYAPLTEEDKNAPGQLLADELREIYHFRSVNRQTRIFGLIGNPINKSPGHLFHNDYFRSHNINAVYVKMGLQPHELSSFFAYAKRLNFGGLSVTSPLKEAVIPYLDEIDPEARAIGAVNTIAFRNGRMIGYNTDGAAAVDVMGDVKNKRIVVLGAGGAAKAIIYMALKRQAHVVVVNRTIEKAQEVAAKYGCGWSPYVPAYDIAVNATSTSMPVCTIDIQPKSRVMDIALYETDFLRVARLRRCDCKNGLPMYFRQALSQQAIWN
jgi:3-dehydroquinate dehydratase / shikimate dehydrogenase